MSAEFSRVEIMTGMGKIADFIGKFSDESTVKKMASLGVTGITVYNNVIGCGVQHGVPEYMTEPKHLNLHLLPKSVVTIVCDTEKVEELVEFLKLELYTGHIGDGKIFISDIRNIIRVRTGEEGADALKASSVD